MRAERAGSYFNFSADGHGRVNARARAAISYDKRRKHARARVRMGNDGHGRAVSKFEKKILTLLGRGRAVPKF